MKFNLAAFADEAGAELSVQIAAMRKNGVGMLEMRGVDGKNCAQLTVQEAKDVCRRLADEGLKVWSLGSPFGKIGIEDGFEEHLEKLRHSLEVCRETGIERIRMFSFYMPEGKDPANYRQAVIDRMGMMLDAAEDAGIRLCHENEKGIYGDNAARCLDLYKTFEGRLGGIFDPANFLQVGQETLPALEMLSPYITYMHIKDARLSDGHVVPAGHGDGHIAELLAHFSKRESDMTLTLEPHLRVFSGLSDLEREGERSNVGNYSYATAEEAFDAACAALRELL